MLETLRIENYALIERVEIDFTRGFNVLSGETGAGKSILIGALQLVLGARASSDAVRQGAGRAQVDAVFLIPEGMKYLRDLLETNEIALEDGRLVLSRTVTADGRSKAYAGGRLVPLTLLAEIGDELVDLHGQHEHQSILRPDKQRELLDTYGGAQPLSARVAELVGHLREVRQRIAALETSDREMERRMDFLRHEIAEIDAAHLEPGQEEELKAQLSRANNAERIYELANLAFTLLSSGEGSSASELAGRAARAVDELSTLDPELSALSDDLNQAIALLEGVADGLRDRTELETFDPRELERLNQRNAALGTLKRKYGGSIEEILAYRDKASAELDSYTSRDAELERLRGEAASCEAEARAAAAKLSAARRRAAGTLDKAVTHNLQRLAMKGASFKVELSPCELGSHGADEVRFLLAANAGEPAKPLKQVASGGEISRIMLALKAVFADVDEVPSLIFDEIDAGIGGAVARNVAETIAQLSRTHQVLCITHLAQIAAVGDSHLRISKAEREGHTVTSAALISGQDRVDEIARLLDGSVSKESIRHARALLKESGGRGGTGEGTT
ncbi:MAG: repair protein RecN [Candidatus Hydrogenedentota bacterium]|jgi:DNA repair protein RecN (Recombination protein N)